MPDGQEFAEWVRSVGPKAVAYARSLLAGPSGQQAEDIVQDVFCRLFARAGDYDLVADGNKLLFRSISNACITAAVRRRELVSIDGQFEAGGASLARNLIGDPADEPASRAMSAELLARIDRAIAALPRLQRAVISLRALGADADEIAQTLELSLNHVFVLTHRARRKLGDLLADVLPEEPS